MIKRTVTGIIMAGFLFLIVFLTGYSHFIFDGLVLLVGIIATYEIYAAVTGKPLKASSGDNVNAENKKTYNISIVSLIVALVIVYPMCYFFEYLGLFYSFGIAMMVAFIIFIFDSNKSFNDFAVNCFAIIYPIILLAIIFIMNKKYGMIPVLLAFVISTVSDAMAYFIGSAIGKRKIFPKISPKKTYAGFFGGIFGGGLGGIIVYLIFELGKFPTYTVFTFMGLFNGNIALTIITYAVVGMIMAVLSEIGDLAASRVKREVGIKDYGKLLGSHGGIMDRIDSVLFSVFMMGIIMEIIKLCA